MDKVNQNKLKIAALGKIKGQLKKMESTCFVRYNKKVAKVELLEVEYA